MTTSTTSHKQRLRAAVVGCGPIGRLHAEGIRSSPICELVAVCDIDPDREAGLAAAFGVPVYQALDELLAAQRPDVITIATPNHQHVQPVLAGLAAGCHVFCEKPLATEWDEVRQLCRAAELHDRHLAVNFNRRFGWGYQLAREWITHGRIGSVTQVLIHVTDGSPPPAVAREPLVMLTTLLVHHFDLLRFLAGEVHSVSATGGPVTGGPLTGNPLTGNLVRQLSITIGFVSGAIGTIVAGYLDGQSRTAERSVVGGELGEIVVDDVSRGVSFRGLNRDEMTVVSPDPFVRGDAFYPTILAHVQDFLRAVAEGSAPSVSADDALRSMAIAQAARESIGLGRPVELIGGS